MSEGARGHEVEATARNETPPDSDGQGLSEVVRKARAAQRDWAEQPVASRIRVVSRLKRSVLSLADELARAAQSETGVLSSEVLLTEIAPIAALTRFWLRTIDEALAPVDVDLSQFLQMGRSGRTWKAPVGVLALITSSVHPIAIPLRTIIPAILVGNAVIWKPSRATSETSRALMRAMTAVLPAGLVSAATDGQEESDTLIAAGIDGVIFSGMADAGRRVLAACAKSLTPATLELGGKDAAVVLADARIERAARGIVWGAFSSGGQSQSSIQRAYVERSIAPAFIARLVALTKALESGRDIGGRLDEQERATVRRQLDEAEKRGAEFLAGGSDTVEHDAPTPTIVRVEDDDVELVRERTPGPVLAVIVVDGIDQAVDRVRSSRFALTTSVWTRSVDRSIDIARRLGTPVVTFNYHSANPPPPEVPWGGRSESGFGIVGGAPALSAFTHTRFVAEDRTPFARDFGWFPYTTALQSTAKLLPKVRGGASPLGRLIAFFSLVWALLKRLFGR